MIIDALKRFGRDKGVIRALHSYFKNICQGYKIYKKIMALYGEETALIVHGWPGMGDIFLLQEYLPYYLEKHHIHEHVILVQGVGAQQVVKLFQENNIERITAEEKDKLVKLKAFLGNKVPNLHILHHDPPAMHTGIGCSIQGIRKTTTRNMLLGVCLGLPDIDVEPKAIAQFDDDSEYIEKIFRENHLLPGKTVILSPYANSCAVPFPQQTWVRIAKTLQLWGFTVCTNSTGPKEPVIEGTYALSVQLKYMKSVIEHAGYFIAVRSGLCDVVGRAKCKMYVLYRADGHCGRNYESDYFNLEKIGLGEKIAEYAPSDLNVRETADMILSDIAAAAGLNYGEESMLSVKSGGNSELYPAFNENNIAVAFSCSNEYVPYLAVTLQSIFDNSTPDNNYDVVVLTEDITIENKQILISLCCATQKNVSIRFVNVSQILSEHELYTWGWYRPIMYGRFLLPDIMKNYEKVIYLDSDLVVLNDISILYNIKFENGECIAAVRDVGMINTYCTPSCKEKDYFDNDLQLKNPMDYINSGVMLFNIPAIREKYTVDYLLRFTASRKWMWQDQDVVMKLFGDKIKLLPQNWNVMIQGLEGTPDLMGTYAPIEIQQMYWNARNHPYIVHYIDNKNLMFNPPCDLFFYFWKYAKKTPYYELILLRAFARNR